MVTVIEVTKMKFYNREKEINNLKEIQSLSSQSSKMTIIIGRRRVGKTRLIREVFQGVDCVYLFVSKKEEAILCEEFKENIQNSLKIKILGEFKRFIDLFEYILQISFDKNITLILDEFQNFIYINSSVFSEFQNIWDSYKEKSKLNLILSGSIYSLMKKIFEDEKEPLFGRADNKINLQPFNVNTIKNILKEFYPEYNNFDLLTFYILSGGIPKYIEIFVDRKAFTLEKQLDLILSENSLFLEEVENLLISEFGKEYRTYFSILELISCGKSSRSEIESILGKNIGGYIERLEKDYLILRQIKPIFSKERTKNIKYEIVDNFINFWFRFLYKYKSAIEIGNFNYIKDIIYKDFNIYCGRFLEKYFIEKLSLEKNYSEIGRYWEIGCQNEIDIVAINEREKKIDFYDVKLNKERINLNILSLKSKKIVNKYEDWNFSFNGLSLEDM